MSTNNRVEPERCYVKFTSNTEKFPTGWRGIRLQELIQREKGNDHSEKNGGKQVRYPVFLSQTRITPTQKIRMFPIKDRFIKAASVIRGLINGSKSDHKHASF